jgi:MmyB-like transcription regulator ligand binding domain
MRAAADPDDADLTRLVGELAVLDPDFSRWWAEHRVNGASYGTKHYRHPLVGDLTLDCDVWSCQCCCQCQFLGRPDCPCARR